MNLNGGCAQHRHLIRCPPIPKHHTKMSNQNNPDEDEKIIKIRDLKARKDPKGGYDSYAPDDGSSPAEDTSGTTDPAGSDPYSYP